MQTLHVQQRCVPPPFDILSRIDIGVLGVPTINASEDRLAFAASCVDHAAGRTGLRREAGGDFVEVASAFLQLVGEDGFELKPASVEDGAVEPRLLSDVDARSFDGAFGAHGHGLDFQILHDDVAEPLGDAERCFVVPVLSNSSSLGRQSRASLELTTAPVRSLFATCQNTLRAPVAAIKNSKAVGQRHALVRAQRQSDGDPAVNTDGCGKRLGDGLVDLARKADVPTEGVVRDSGGQQFAFDCSGAPKFYPAYFRQAHLGPLCIQGINFDDLSRKAETVIVTLPSGRRIMRSARKEICESFFKISKSLLLTCRMAIFDKIELFSQSCKFTTLCSIINFMLSSPCFSLLQSEIINKPANARKLMQQPFLTRSRVQSETNTTMHQRRASSIKRRIISDTVMPSRSASAFTQAICGAVNVTVCRTVVAMRTTLAPLYHPAQGIPRARARLVPVPVQQEG